jgi:hypothetical protein
MEAGNEYSGSVVAKLLCITERRLQQLAREGVVPKSSRGKYPLIGSVQGYVRYLQTSGEQAEGARDPEKMKPFERRAWYEGELDKLQLSQKRGQLVPAIEVESKFAELLKQIAQFLETLPDMLERVGGSPKMLKLLELELDKMRDAMYASVVQESNDAGSAVQDRP